MSFAGKVWRLLVGIKDGLSLLFLLLFFAALFALLSARPNPGRVHEGALLLDLDGYVVEERSEIDPLELLLAQEAPLREFEARELVRALDAATTDDRVKAVVLDLSRFVGGGQVHLQEIGEALDRVRAAKKPVFAFANAYADDGLMLAAHANEVWVDPLGGAIIAGPGGTRLYYAELLEKLGVNARVYRVGTFKAAVEPFTRNSMSDEARENIGALYSALWEEWQANVKKARPRMDIRRVTEDPSGWVAATNGDLAKAALEAGLVDRLGSWEEFAERVARVAGENPWNDEPGSFASTPLEPFLAAHPLPRKGKAIGVITIAGEIVDGEEGPGIAGGERIASLLDEALDDDLAALVVRVDSPGGSVMASEQIRRAIERHRAKGIPVAISMANVAASGGYWVSTPGDRIFAQPETVTGSIGVFAIIPTFEGTAAKLGVHADGYRTTPLSGQPDLVGGFTPEVDSLLQGMISDTYRDFLGLVSKARKLDTERVDSIAQGRVWDGGSARQLGLVDQFGGLEDAARWAAAKAGIKDGKWHLRYLGSQAMPYEALIRRLIRSEEQPAARGDLFALLAQQQEGIVQRALLDAQRLREARGAQALCLGCPPSPGRADLGAGALRTGWLARAAAALSQ